MIILERRYVAHTSNNKVCSSKPSKKFLGHAKTIFSFILLRIFSSMDLIKNELFKSDFVSELRRAMILNLILFSISLVALITGFIVSIIYGRWIQETAFLQINRSLSGNATTASTFNFKNLPQITQKLYYVKMSCYYTVFSCLCGILCIVLIDKCVRKMANMPTSHHGRRPTQHPLLLELGQSQRVSYVPDVSVQTIEQEPSSDPYLISTSPVEGCEESFPVCSNFKVAKAEHFVVPGSRSQSLPGLQRWRKSKGPLSSVAEEPGPSSGYRSASLHGVSTYEEHPV